MKRCVSIRSVACISLVNVEVTFDLSAIINPKARPKHLLPSRQRPLNIYITRLLFAL